jgi:tetratricopeptide (TPR) repeat protein
MRFSALAGSASVSLAFLLVTSARLHAQAAEAEVPRPALTTAENAAHIRDALASLELVLQQSRTSGDRKGEANTLSAIANSYNSLHQQQRAIEQFQAAGEIWRQLGDKDHQATTLAHIGDVYRLWGFPELANRYYRDALLNYPDEDKAGRGATLNNLSLTYFSLNNRKKCFESLAQALAIFRQLQDPHGEALALANLGAAYTYLVNDPLKAVAALQQATNRLDLLNDRASEAGALDQMGVAWHMLGRSEMAGISFQRALGLFHEIGNSDGEAMVRKHLRTLGEQQTQASSR